MEKKATLTFFLILVGLVAGWTQVHPHCGTSLESFQKIEKRLITNKLYLKEHPVATSRSATTYIPVKFHLVAKSDGTGRADYNRVLDQLCLLNEVFQEFDISFYIKDGFNEVDDTGIYSNQIPSSVQSRMRRQKDFNALNIWVLGEVTTGNGNNIVLGVYDDQNDWVRVINDKTYFGINGYTLPHEIGHFFSLLHPFYGWEIAPYSQEMEGKPAPARAPHFDALTEHADGSNCEIAGDRICDTPADYWYSFYVNSSGDTINNLDNFSCKYDRPMTDPKGERLNPDPSLIMGYFLDQCMDHFTPDQIEIMQSDLAQSTRAYLRSDYTPSEGPITESPELLAPLNSEEIDSYNWVPLSWQHSENATGYLIEISTIPGFSNSPFNYISSTNSFTATDLEPSKNYFWRVTPYNDNFTCASPSSRGRFKTGLSTSTKNIETVNNWSIFPNPTTPDQGMTLSIEATSFFEADLKIYSITGQLLKEQRGISFAQGMNQEQVDIADISEGIYFLFLENETGVLNQKIVISK